VKPAAAKDVEMDLAALIREEIGGSGVGGVNGGISLDDSRHVSAARPISGDGGACIVYCFSQRETEQVAASLSTAGVSPKP